MKCLGEELLISRLTLIDLYACEVLGRTMLVSGLMKCLRNTLIWGLIIIALWAGEMFRRRIIILISVQVKYLEEQRHHMPWLFFHEL